MLLSADGMSECTLGCLERRVDLCKQKDFFGEEGKHNKIILIQISSIVLMWFFVLLKIYLWPQHLKKIYKSIIFLIE